MLIGLVFVFSYFNTRVLRIQNVKSGEIYIEIPIKTGDVLYFGWIHSLEHIPWDEYYHIRKDNVLVLDTICFPAFGAGIPENKGKTSVRNGLIYMEDIGQEFPFLYWLNSKTNTRDIKLNGKYISSGWALPYHEIVTLKIERRGVK